MRCTITTELKIIDAMKQRTQRHKANEIQRELIDRPRIKQIKMGQTKKETAIYRQTVKHRELTGKHTQKTKTQIDRNTKKKIDILKKTINSQTNQTQITISR